MSTEPPPLRNAAAIVGVGRTACSRNSERTAAGLASDAVRAALEDAGIDPQQVDGLVPYAHGAKAEDVVESLNLKNVHFTATTMMGGAGPVAGLKLAAMALSSGLAQYVVMFVGRTGSTSSRVEARVQALVPGQELRESLEVPHGLSLPVQWFALVTQRHMYEHGTTREQLGHVAVAHREHALRNPDAQMHGRPITLDDHLNSRPIAEPYHLLDCCLESDGGSAVVLTNSRRASEMHATPVLLAGVGEGHPENPASFANRQDFFDIGLKTAAPDAFAMAGLGATDMDMAMIYDCFTFEVLHQLEVAGFCAPGESGDFVQSGAIRLGGDLPVNTHGGLLSDGHLAGCNHIVEAVAQLRGECSGRQIENAETAFVSGFGDMGDGSAAVLTVAR